jgi:hypothetical protein
VATVCVDDRDFEVTPDGLLQARAVTAQSANVTFAHQLNGVDGTYEIIGELPAVVAPEDGRYLVLWDIHGNVALPGPNLGIPLNGQVQGALAVGGVFVPGTESMIASLNEGATNVDFPALGQEGATSGSRVLDLVAGTTVQIMGAQRGNGSNISTIQSDADGRCRVTLVRLGP